MRLKTNLATRRYINTRGVNLALGSLCALLACWLLYQTQDAAFRAGEIKRLKSATAASSAARESRSPQVSETQYRDLMAQVQSANQMLAQRSLDWVALLDRLEEVVPEGVALNSIAPDRKTMTVKLSGVARSFSNLRVLLENLERSSYFSEVYLLNQGQTKVGLTQRGVTFSLTCKASQL